jgi:hypothetical protein
MPVEPESAPARAALYRDAIALAMAAWGRSTAPAWLEAETHALCRAAIDDVMRGLSGAGSLSGRHAEIEVREMHAELRAAGRLPSAGLVHLPRAQAALAEQLERLPPEPPLRRSARIFWSSIALALTAWGRDDGALQAEVPTALEAACAALASRRDAGLEDARALVGKALGGARERAGPFSFEHPDTAPPVATLVEVPEAAAGALECLQQAEASWRAGVEACRWAPPDAWFPRRLTRLAEAGAEQSEAFRRAGAAGVRWKGAPEAHVRVQLRVAYELHADARPGPAHLWDEFDRAESDLVQTYDGVPLDVGAIADGFARISAATSALADSR